MLGKLGSGSWRAVASAEIVVGLALVAMTGMIGLSQFDRTRRIARIGEAERDLWRIGQAAEAYLVDNGGYPPSFRDSTIEPLTVLAAVDWRAMTTPVPYMNEMPRDVFKAPDEVYLYTRYSTYAVGYSSSGSLNYSYYPHVKLISWSRGPDQWMQTGGWRSPELIMENEGLATPQIGINTPPEFGGVPSVYNGMRYDPSNGIISVGDIYMFGGTSAEGWGGMSD